MKINSKTAKMKLFLPTRGLFILLTTVIFFFISSSISFAPTKMIDDSNLSKTKSINFVEKRLMSDSELSETNAQAFFNITQYDSSYGTGSANVIKLDLNARLEIKAHVDSFKMGYYNNGTNTNWDFDGTNFYFGGSNQLSNANALPLVWQGLVLEVGFDNISNSTTRKLNYIDLGTMSASGPITGTFAVMNALASTAGTGQNNGILLRQTIAGRENITFLKEPLSFLFAAKYDYKDDSGYTTHGISGIYIKIPQQSTRLGY